LVSFETLEQLAAQSALVQAAMEIVHSAADALENSASAMEQYALGLGYTYSDPAGAWTWFHRELSRQTPQGNLPNVQNLLANTPPFHAILAWYWWKKDPESAPINACFDGLVNLHRYWYEQRDPAELGLPAIHFAEESLIPEFLKNVYHSTPFKVQDPAFLGLLCRANECLIELGEALGKDLTELLQWQELTIFGLNEDLWDAQLGVYRMMDLDSGKSLRAQWLSNYIPLWAGVPDQEQAEKMCRSLVKGFFRENYWVLPTQIPTESTSETEANEVVSPLLNRLIYAGLLRYGFKENANYLNKKALQMVGSYGFYPNYKALMHPYDNIGIGKGNAAGTAAIVLDMANGVLEKSSFEQIW
jgi:hypothetical protein